MIGIYGGTFDPIHYGHLRPALDVIDALGIEKCHFIPCSVPHHRALPFASTTQRLEMIAAAIKTEPRFFLDSREIDRNGISYTFDTLKSIHQDVLSNQTLCLILGVDAFLQFEQWHRWQDILNLCHIVVTHRPGWDINMIFDSNQISTELDSVISSCLVTDKIELSKSQSGKIIFQAVTQLDISATRIRYLLANNNSIRYLLPDDVYTVIKNQKIYVN